MPKHTPAIERFWAKVAVAESCWLWLGGRTEKGYGTFWDGTRKTLAHRFAYELLVGPIPEGLTIDHVKARGCVHRHCVNPAHLEPVTRGENVMRGETVSAIHARKTHCPNGHPYDVIDSAGARRCRRCHAAVELARYHRKKAAS